MNWAGLMIGFQDGIAPFESYKRIVIYRTTGPTNFTEDNLDFTVCEKRCPSHHKAISSDARHYQGKFGYKDTPGYCESEDPKCRFSLDVVDSREDFLRRIQESAQKTRRFCNEMPAVIAEIREAPAGSRFLFGFYAIDRRDEGAGSVALALTPMELH
jgi:hypothetical protein